jgi:3',5'-cyclic AMP phosphodiesterase CpdA
MKLLHISDLHFPTTVPIFSLRWKMFSGYFNYKLRRQKKYPKEILNALIDHIKSQPYDLLLISGDLTNVSHEKEFQIAREILNPLLDKRAFIVPGNHDRYIQSSITPMDLFLKYFEPFMGESVSKEKYIRIKKIDNICIVGLDSNYVSGIGNASGRLQDEVLEETFGWLDKQKITDYLLVCHHPLWNPEGQEESMMHRMINRDDVIRKLKNKPPLAYFHGHKHSNFYKKPNAEIPFAILNSASSTMIETERNKSGYHSFDIHSEKLIVKRYAYRDMTFKETDTIEY